MQKPIAAALVFAFLLCAPRFAAAQRMDPAFRADIEKLLTLTGGGNLAAQMSTALTTQVVAGLKQRRPSMPDRAGEIVKEVLGGEFSKWAASPDGLQARAVTIYASQFTHDEVKKLLAFHQSDVGRKWLSVMPAIARESMAAGQQWSQANMPRILAEIQRRLKAEGIVN